MALVRGFAPSPSPGRVWEMLKHMQEVLGLAPPSHPIPSHWHWVCGAMLGGAGGVAGFAQSLGREQKPSVTTAWLYRNSRGGT